MDINFDTPAERVCPTASMPAHRGCRVGRGNVYFSDGRLDRDLRAHSATEGSNLSDGHFDRAMRVHSATKGSRLSDARRVIFSRLNMCVEKNPRGLENAVQVCVCVCVCVNVFGTRIER